MVITPYNTVTTKAPKEVITMVKIISLFIQLLNFINKLSFKLECFLIRFLPRDPTTLVLSEQYRKFKVDPIPTIKEENLPISLEQAFQLYKDKHNGNVPKPINRRVSLDAPTSLKCPHCGASIEFIFDNKSGKTTKQYRCKICDTVFSPDKSYQSQIAHYCPYCGYKLQGVHDRSNYIVYKCKNYHCTFYKHNLKSLSKEEKQLFKKQPTSFKLHYITRVFDASLKELEQLQRFIKPSTVDLSKIRKSKHILGLLLTYHINYGLSLRKTALIMQEIHDINVSHQTVANYAQAASHLLDPWLNSYQYDGLTSEHCGDETYVKIRGKNAYVFFMCDSIKKIITSYTIFLKRDTFSAIQTFYSVIRKFTVIPKDLKIIVDGNPIYIAAQQYFKLQNINFDVFQVIGLQNKDEVSKKYRAPKQIIERLNRTFKYSYYVKNGFDSLEKANEFMCLFTTYFNFLRKHTTLGHKPPVILDELKDIKNMPTKWQILLDIALTHNIESNLPFD